MKEASQAHRKRKKAKHHLAAGGVALAALAMTITGVMTSGALFTDSKTVTNNVFSTGTVALTAAKPVNLSASGLAPGDVTFGYINVTNTGSLAMRYSIQNSLVTNTNGVASHLNIQMKKTTQANCTVAGFAAGTALINSTLGASALLGNPAAGAHAGDQTLAAGATDGLCFRIELLTSAPNTVQNSSANSTLTFSAEQTANN